MSAATYLSPLQTIRTKCRDCSCGSAKEVNLCPVTTCALWPYRFGKHPFKAKPELTDAERIERISRLTRVRKCRRLRVTTKERVTRHAA